MGSNGIGSILSVVLCCSLLNPGPISGQQFSPVAAQPSATPHKYKLTVLENASLTKRVKHGRVSSQAVVKITDENNVPVPGAAVYFTLPQTGGATFASGGLTSLVTTNTAGIASSGSYSAAAGSSFSVSVAASVPGSVVLTAAVPVTVTATAAGAVGVAAAAAGAAGAGGGISTGVIVGIVAAVAAGGIGAAVALKGKSANNTTTATGGATVTVGGPSSITFGGPK